MALARDPSCFPVAAGNHDRPRCTERAWFLLIVPARRSGSQAVFRSASGPDTRPQSLRNVVMTMRLRIASGSSAPAPARNNRHISCIDGYTKAAGDPGTAGKAEMNTSAHAHDTTTPAARPARRADAGTIRLSQRDIDGLLLVGEHTGAPYDLLARALQVDQDPLPPILARWRRAGYAATGRLGPGPGW